MDCKDDPDVRSTSNETIFGRKLGINHSPNQPVHFCEEFTYQIRIAIVIEEKNSGGEERFMKICGAGFQRDFLLYCQHHLLSMSSWPDLANTMVQCARSGRSATVGAVL